MPEIPILLEAEPKVGAHAGYPSQSERRVRRHTPFAVDHLVEARKGDPELQRERRLSDPKRLEELLQEHLPPESRGPVETYAPTWWLYLLVPQVDVDDEVGHRLELSTLRHFDVLGLESP